MNGVPLVGKILRLPWLRWLGEFAIIVVGVLVALAVDSYREDRVDDARERVYLANLQADLQIDEVNLRIALGYARTGLRQAEALMFMLDMDLDRYILRSELQKDGYDRATIGPQSYIVTIPRQATEKGLLGKRGRRDEVGEAGAFASWPVGIFDTFTAYEATYNTLLSTGDLKIIQRDSLRRAISSYYERVRRNNADAEDMGLQIQRLNDVLRSNDINPYDPEDLARIGDIPGIKAALALARDRHHWWYVRKLAMRSSFDALQSELSKELQRRGIVIERVGG